MSTNTTHQTALCLIPPSNFWEQIQSIRSVHDKAYPRWMPHINLVYPFAPETEFSTLKSRLDSVLNQRQALEIEFDQSSIQYFKQKGQECTFNLRPKRNKDVVELYEAIKNQLTDYIKDTRSFEPHLTLGQATTSRISDVLYEIKAKWKPIKFTIDRVCLISRQNDSNDLFSIKNQVLLVGSTSSESISYEQPVVIKEKPTVNNKIIPSAPLKTTLCIVPPMEFSSRLLHLFEETSFRPQQPFRIVLAEYSTYPNETELRTQIEVVPKFTVNFGARSICFNYSTTRLFLKPMDIEPIGKLNLLKNQDFDGSLTLGELDKQELTDVGNRFTEHWSYSTHEFEVDRVHLIDSNGRFQCSFPLKNQCFS